MAFQRKKDDLFQKRKLNIQAIFTITAIILIVRAFGLQVLDKEYANQAEATAVSKKTIYPSRGLIYDRNLELLTINNPVYDVTVTYNQINPKMDTTKFCQLLGINKTQFSEALNKDFRRDYRYSKYKPFVFLKKISAETFARFQESMYQFPGFDIQVRNVRGYPHEHAAHLLGYIREVNAKELRDSSTSYTIGDYIGANGLEKEYEEELRGTKGASYALRDARGRHIDKYQDGKKDENAFSGKNLITTIDIDLQAYCEELMKNKVGGIVAIEPATGEILSLVSAPSYNPNILTINRSRGKAYTKLQQDSLKPLLNRALIAEYPPGSTFKPVMALVAMQLGVLNPDKYLFCPGYYDYNGTVWGCRQHTPNYHVGVALQWSCNSYFFDAFRKVIDIENFYKPEVGLDTLNYYLEKFGMGKKLGIDFPIEKRGNVPVPAYYDRQYPSKDGGWKWSTIVSLGIGQGEFLMSTLQIANVAAILANNGHYYQPHLVKGYVGRAPFDYENTRQDVGINQEYFPPVIAGMSAAVSAGTAQAAQVPGINIAGKTGTVQNPHGKDHSTFIAFAPVENPKIAIAVFVENAGGGGRYAAPIASLLIEKYLNGDIKENRVWKENQVLEANLIKINP